MISAQILHESKRKWRVAPKRKTGAAAKQTADSSTALQSQMTMEPWNHGTMEPWNHLTIQPLSQKSQMDQECGLLPADPRQQRTRQPCRQKNSLEKVFQILISRTQSTPGDR